MSFIVQNIMERVPSEDAGLVIEFIRDAFKEMARDKLAVDTKVQKYNIADGRMKYNLPTGAVSVVGVSVLYESNASEMMEDNDRTFAAANNWTNTDFTTYDETDDLSVTNTSANLSCYLDDEDLITVDHRYRLTYDATIGSGAFELKTYTGNVKLGDFEDGTSKVIEFTAPETGELKIQGTAASGAADFDNFSLMEVGEDEYKTAAKLVGTMPSNWYDEETDD